MKYERLVSLKLLTLKRVDFHGTPSESLRQQMREKARLLGDAAVVVNPLQACFARFV